MTHNFGAGPCILPQEVFKQAAQAVLEFNGTGLSILEISHRTPEFEAVVDETVRLVKELLNVPVVLEENEWGIDHGAWSVLKYMYPHADVPIVQLSLDGSMTARAHYEFAKQLRPLRDENILILSSGNVVHNLRTIDWHDNAVPHVWAKDFNAFFISEMRADHHESLIDWERYGDAAHLSIPTAEHYWPALYTLALQEDGEHAKVFVDGIEMSSISMLGFSIQ